MEWLGYTVVEIVAGVVVAVMVVMRRPPPSVAVALVLSLIASMGIFAWTTGDVFGFVFATFWLGCLMVRLSARRRAPTEPGGKVASQRRD